MYKRSQIKPIKIYKYSSNWLVQDISSEKLSIEKKFDYSLSSSPAIVLNLSYVCLKNMLTFVSICCFSFS